MNDGFDELYNSRCKFMRKYINCLVYARGKDNFLWGIAYRAARFYGIQHKYSRKIIEEHLARKFTPAAMDIIKREKILITEKRKADRERKIETDRQTALERPMIKRSRFSRIMEVVSMRICGCSYTEIGKELGVTPGQARQLFVACQTPGYRAEVRYLLELLWELEKL